MASKKTTAQKNSPKAKAKAKTKPKKPTKPKPNGVAKRRKKSVDPAAMRLRGNLYFEFRALSAELSELSTRSAMAISKLTQLSKDPVHAPVFMSIADKDQAISDYNKKRKEFAATQLKVAKHFGLSPEELQKYTVNTETGIVTFTPPKQPGD